MCPPPPPAPRPQIHAHVLPPPPPSYHQNASALVCAGTSLSACPLWSDCVAHADAALRLGGDAAGSAASVITPSRCLPSAWKVAVAAVVVAVVVIGAGLTVGLLLRHRAATEAAQAATFNTALQVRPGLSAPTTPLVHTCPAACVRMQRASTLHLRLGDAGRQRAAVA